MKPCTNGPVHSFAPLPCSVVLRLAALKWRDENNLTWLEAPPLLTTLNERETQRVPYPLTWEQQRLLLAELPEYLHKMALYKVNTGCREQEVCLLRWDYEVEIPELGTSVFLIPWNFGGRRPNSGVKNRYDPRPQAENGDEKVHGG